MIQISTTVDVQTDEFITYETLTPVNSIEIVNIQDCCRDRIM